MTEDLKEQLVELLGRQKAQLMSELPTLVSYGEISLKYGMSVKTLYAMDKETYPLPFFKKIGKMKFIDLDLFKQYLKEQSKGKRI